MEDHTADALVNRDEPIPVFAPASQGSDATSSDNQSKRERLKQSLSASKLKDKIHDVGFTKTESPQSLQDRLFTKLLQQVIPSEDLGDIIGPPDKRSTSYVNRPGFSLPLMTSNFRRFNARVGVIFLFQTQLIRLLCWKTTSHTLSLLAVYTFVCLDPYLLSVLPVVLALFFVMVPAFLVRHPPPPSSISNSPSYYINGPPVAPPRIILPAAEMSKDFFRNMRDLQNCMDDFSNVHDIVLKTVTPSTNFSNEPLSSALFLFLFIIACSLSITSHLLPWRFICLLAGWTTIALGHPNIQDFVLTSHKEHFHPHEKTLQGWLDKWISHDIVLDAPAETREVEIFELQHKTGGSNGEWEAWVFSPSPYDPLSPQRISGDRPKGTRFFEDVVAPPGWEWSDKKWMLDMGSREWVEERMVQGVEVEVEGERWVNDLADLGIEDYEGDFKALGKGKEKLRVSDEGKGTGLIGDWRRRRWVRMVRRKVL